MSAYTCKTQHIKKHWPCNILHDFVPSQHLYRVTWRCSRDWHKGVCEYEQCNDQHTSPLAHAIAALAPSTLTMSDIGVGNCSCLA